MKTEEILNEREKTHGDFKTASETHYKAKELFRAPMQKNGVPLYRIEAIEAIIAKINRIAHGNHDHADHWDDIAGYAMLGKGKELKEVYLCRRCAGMKTQEDMEVIEPEIGYGICKECAPKARERTPKLEPEDEAKIVMHFFKQAIEKIDNGLNELKNKYPNLFQDESGSSTSSKMEHAPLCERCGGDTGGKTVQVIAGGKFYCFKCAGEIAGEACRQKMEHVSEERGDCIKNEPDYSIRHMFSCQYKLSGCDCVSFCKVKAGYKT